MYKQAILAAIAATASAQTAEERAKYPDWAEKADHWKMEWESFELEVAGYTLTLFHTTGFSDLGPIEISKPPLLMVHAMSQNAEEWIDPAAMLIPNLPLSMQLAADGYDVWFANLRASKYGAVHDTYTITDAEYWDFTWYDQGVEDQLEMVKFIYDKTGGRKVSMYGYSQGTSSSLAGVSEKPEEYSKYANVIGL